MPLYDYRCIDCGVQDFRIAGLDDHAVLCVRCGGVMLRQVEDVFEPYFDESGRIFGSRPFFGTCSQENGIRQLRRVQ